ncbi:MAG: alginate export family protein, partial [Planctomycetota bacterium]
MMASILALAAALPTVQDGTVYPLDNRRYPESYAGLPADEGPWWSRFKNRPLDASGAWRFDFGLELRAQSETFRGDGLREAEDDGLDYIWWRALPVFDVRGPGVRFFTQLVFAAASGLDEEPSPIDASRGDVQQAFVEAPFEVAGRGLRLRARRRLLAYGSQRLVGYRYGPNVPLPFDGVSVTLEEPGFTAEALWQRPVGTREGAFDDSARDGESLYGLYTTTAFEDQGLDLYYLGHRENAARYDAGAADEDRHTVGARWFGAAGRFDWNAEAFFQTGEFGAQDIRAWSATVEAGAHLGGEPDGERGEVGALRVFARASVVSGDRDPDDDELGTFDPLYPRGKYFGEIGTIGPSNLMDALVGAQVDLGSGFELEASTNAYWRHSRGDGIYANNGALLRSGAGSDARFVGLQ